MYPIFNIGMIVPLRIELKNWVYTKKQVIFYMKLHVINSLNNLSVSIYDSPKDVSDNRLFHLSGETNCLFTTSVWQATKTCMLPTALDFPEDMSHRSVLALKIQGFS